MRLGLRMVKGLSNDHAADLIGARGEQPYRTVADVWQRAGVPVAALERIAEADGFHALGLDRRAGAVGDPRPGGRPTAAVRRRPTAGAPPSPRLMDRQNHQCRCRR